MSKSATKYQVTVGDVELAKLESKKATAIEVARRARRDNQADVKVTTTNGTEVFSMKAPKHIKMSKPFTRVVDVPEGVELPEGDWRPAYDRSRKHLFILHNAEDGDYAVYDFAAGEFLAEGLATTRDAGAYCKTVPLPAKA